MKKLIESFKQAINRFFSFLIWLTGIPWVTSVCSSYLAKRGLLLCAAILGQWVSIAFACCFVWMAVIAFNSNENLKGTSIGLGALLAIIKLLDPILDSYRELKLTHSASSK